MDRQIVTPGQIPLDTDLLYTNKNTMLAMGDIMATLFGSNTIAYGLNVTQTSPASMNVNVWPGSIYSLSTVDATEYGSIPADLSDTVMKQGILLATQQVTLIAPTTIGYSTNYLIEAAFSEVDGIPQLLQFYNADNPQQPYVGPGGNNQQINTRRQGQVSIVAKPGISAATGSQITPAPDTGYVGLAVVTVTYGQTQITTASITAIKSNVLPSDLLDSIQQNRLDYAIDTGSSNAYVISLQPTPTAIPDGFVATFQASSNNTNNSTLNVNGFGVYPILGIAHAALQGGEIVSGGKCEVMWHQSLQSWILLGCTGGSQQLGAGSYGTTPAQFDTSTKLATMQAVQRALGSYAGQTDYSTATVLTVADVGKITVMVAANATLPKAGVCGAGSAICLTAATTNCVLSAASGDSIGLPSGATVSSITIPPQGNCVLSRNVNGTGWNVQTSSDVALQYSPYFTSVLSSPGYQKLPGGIIIQWGSWTSSATTGGAVGVSFPLAFPNALLRCVVSAGSGSTIAYASSGTSTSTGFNAYASVASIVCSYIAIGY